MDRYSRGPRGTLNVYEMPNMASNMLRTILYFFVTVFTIAYITHVACPPGDTTTTKVFRIAGTIGVLVYGTSGVLNRIWFVERMWTHVVDGLVYGVVVGLLFACMWPGERVEFSARSVNAFTFGVWGSCHAAARTGRTHAERAPAAILPRALHSGGVDRNECNDRLDDPRLL